MVEGIAVAVIGAIGAVLAALIQSLRRENRRDHGVVQEKLDQLSAGHTEIKSLVETVRDNHMRHIEDHAKGDL